MRIHELLLGAALLASAQFAEAASCPSDKEQIYRQLMVPGSMTAVDMMGCARLLKDQGLIEETALYLSYFQTAGDEWKANFRVEDWQDSPSSAIRRQVLFNSAMARLMLPPGSLQSFVVDEPELYSWYLSRVASDHPIEAADQPGDAVPEVDRQLLVADSFYGTAFSGLDAATQAKLPIFTELFFSPGAKFDTSQAGVIHAIEWGLFSQLQFAARGYEKLSSRDWDDLHQSQQKLWSLVPKIASTLPLVEWLDQGFDLVSSGTSVFDNQGLTLFFEAALQLDTVPEEFVSYDAHTVVNKTQFKGQSNFLSHAQAWSRLSGWMASDKRHILPGLIMASFPQPIEASSRPTLDSLSQRRIKPYLTQLNAMHDAFHGSGRNFVQRNICPDRWQSCQAARIFHRPLLKVLFTTLQNAMADKSVLADCQKSSACPFIGLGGVIQSKSLADEVLKGQVGGEEYRLVLASFLSGENWSQSTLDRFVKIDEKSPFNLSKNRLFLASPQSISQQLVCFQYRNGLLNPPASDPDRQLLSRFAPSLFIFARMYSEYAENVASLDQAFDRFKDWVIAPPLSGGYRCDYGDHYDLIDIYDELGIEFNSYIIDAIPDPLRT